ncbi:hypothetical protein LJC11_03725 [Bacteroidales bacterium OttesenSCG-928-I21]|nr:hypothetical protein [Bacteroidales bacterium OttesenSCG-928-I21]
MNYTNANNCTGLTPAEHHIIVNSVPTPTFISSGSGDVCPGSVVTYKTQPGMTDYEWTITGASSYTGGNSTSSTATVTWGSSGTGEVHVNYKTSAGCLGSAPAVADITISAAVTPSLIAPDVLVCSGEEVQYSTQGGMSNYTWVVTGGSITSGGTATDDTALITWGDGPAGSVSVNYTPAVGCMANSSTPISIAINTTPVVTPIDKTLCEGSTLAYNTLGTVSAGSLYVYADDNSVAALTGSTVVSSSHTYYVEAKTTQDCSSDRVPAIVTMNAKPVFTVTNPSAICEGSNYVLSDAITTTETGYTLSFKQSGSPVGPTVDPISTTTYQVVMTSDASCVSEEKNITVTVNPKPLVQTKSVAPICLGESIDLSSGVDMTGVVAGTTFAYYSNQSGTTSPQTVTPLTSGTHTYYVRATLNTCVSDYAAITLTVHARPTVVANPQTLCEGEVLYYASLGTSTTGVVRVYDAQTGGNELTGQVSVSTTTTYYILSDDGQCESSSRIPVTITVNPKPTFDLLPSVSICQGGSYNLSNAISNPVGSNAVYTYRVKGSASTLSNSVVDPGSITTYEVIMTARTGAVGTCDSDVKEITVNVNPLPTVTITDEDDMCVGGSLILSATPAGGTWSFATPTTSATINASTGEINATKVGHIEVVYNYTDVNSCSNSATSAPIVINALPTVNAVNQTICPGEYVTYESLVNLTSLSSGAQYIVYEDALGTTPVVGTGTVIAATRSYYVGAINPTTTCESAVLKEAKVTVNDKPTFTFTENPITICDGTVIDIRNYVNTTLHSYDMTVIQGGATLPSSLVGPSVNTNYSVSITSGNNCSSDAETFTVNIGVTTNIVIGGVDEICYNSTEVLTVDALYSGGTWSSSSPSILQVDNSGNIIGKSIIGGMATINYVFIDANGCENFGSKDIIVNVLPNLTITNQSICSGETIYFYDLATTDAGNELLFYANMSDVTAITAPSTILTSTTTYYVEARNMATNCVSQRKPVVVTVNPLPSFDILPMVNICFGGDYDLSSALSNFSTGNYTLNYRIKNGANLNNSTVDPIANTSYEVIMTNTVTGCVSETKEITVFVNPLPIITITGDGRICEGELGNYVATPNATTTYAWSSSDINIAEIDSNGELTAHAGGSVQIRYDYTDANGCSNFKTKTVVINPLPNLTVAGNSRVCSGTEIMYSDLVLSHGGNLLEYTINGTPVIGDREILTATTTYEIISVNTITGCESASQSVTVSVDEKPDFTVDNTLVVCENTTVHLSSLVNNISGVGSQGYTINFTTQGGTSVGESVIPTVPQSIYRATLISNASGCISETKEITVGVTPTPVIQVRQIAAVCEDTQVDLETAITNAATFTSINYFKDQQGQISVEQLVTPAVGSSIYYAQGESNGCNSVLTPIHVNVNALPEVPVIGSLNVCEGTSEIYTGPSDMHNYSWTVTNGTITSGASSQIAIVEWNTPGIGTISLSVTNANNCTNASPVFNVNVIEKPSFNLNINTASICFGEGFDLFSAIDNTNLPANSNFSYRLQGGTWTSTSLVNPTISGTYTYEIILTEGLLSCSSDIHTFVLEVKELPSVRIYGGDVCINGDIQFEAVVNPVGGTGTWRISNTAVATIVEDSETTATVTGGHSEGSFYVIYVYETADGCQSEEVRSEVYSVYPLPTVRVSDATICNGSSIAVSELVLEVINADRYYVYDAPTAGNIVGNEISPTDTTTYYVEAVASNATCITDGRVPVTVNVIDRPTFTLPEFIGICEGGSVNLASYVSDANISNYTVISYYGNEHTPLGGNVVQPTANNELYNVQIESLNGLCISERQAIRIIFGQHTDVQITGDIELCLNTTGQLTSSYIPSGRDTYYWTSSNPEVVEVMTYTGAITAYSAGTAIIRYHYTTETGCVGTGSKMVRVDEAPSLTNVQASVTVCQGTTIMLESLATTTIGNKLNFYQNNNLIDVDRIVCDNDMVLEVEAENLNNGCISSRQSIKVTVITKPVFTLTAPSDVCEGESINLEEIIGNIFLSSYDVYYYDDLGRELPSSVIVALAGTTTYQIKVVERSLGCESDLQTVDIIVNPLPQTGDVSLVATLPDGMQITQGNNGFVCENSSVIITGSYTSATWEIVFSHNGTEYTINDQNPTVSILVEDNTEIILISVSNTTTGCILSNYELLSGMNIRIDKKEQVSIVSAPQDARVCLPDGEAKLSIEVSGNAGDVYTYEWRNASGTVVGSQAELTVTEPGTYTVSVDGGCNVVTASAVVTVELPVIEQIRHHTLLVNNNPDNNGGYTFYYYKWYKNDELIWEGRGKEEKGGYYFTGGSNLDFYGEYWAVMMDEFGVEHRSCAFIPSPSATSVRIVSYPNPTSVSKPVVTVEVESSDKEILDGATIVVISPLGMQLDVIDVKDYKTEVRLPSVPGSYILQYRSSVMTKEIKTIVVE